MTPETDAKESPHIGFYSCATVPAEFARKLERERDEALEDARLLSERLTRLELDSTLALAKLERERNQWRIQYEQAERVLQDIATGTSCRECGGEDQARLAREALEGAK